MTASMQTSLNRRPAVAKTEELHLGDVSFADLAAHFHEQPDFVLLHSQTNDVRLDRYSLFSFAPVARLVTKGLTGRVRIGGCETQCEGDPFDMLQSLLKPYELRRLCDNSLPFFGGALGYFSYELGHRIEVLPSRAVDDIGTPDMYVGIYTFAVVEEHSTGRTFLCWVGSADSAEPESTIASLRAELALVRHGEWAARLSASKRVVKRCFSDLTRGEYLDAVCRIKEYILAGDVYQVNMTQRFQVEIDEHPWCLYRRLADINAAPFAAYLNFEGHVVVSSSPERFLSLSDRRVETRPIKGTIARGATPEKDELNRVTLCESAKNRAELAMIVDLLRNDIGRVCTPGSVSVGRFPELESYASVHHLVATVTGDLEEGCTTVDLLKATFPGGSITGAPKIRAMEIIDELEPVARGVYTGSIGYIGFDGRADLNIAIRTAIIHEGRAYIHAGGGIVADSDESDEYDESLLKASKLLQAVGADLPSKSAARSLSAMGRSRTGAASAH